MAELDAIILTLRMLGHPHLGPHGISDFERSRLLAAADLLEVAEFPEGNGTEAIGPSHEI